MSETHKVIVSAVNNGTFGLIRLRSWASCLHHFAKLQEKGMQGNQHHSPVTGLELEYLI